MRDGGRQCFFLHGFELKIRRFQRWKNIWPAGMNSNGSTSSLKLRKQKLPYDNINVLQLLLSPSLSLKTQRRLARQIMEGCSVQEWRKHVHGPFRFLLSDDVVFKIVLKSDQLHGEQSAVDFGCAIPSYHPMITNSFRYLKWSYWTL